MTRKTCSVSGCRARAWHHDLCNLHALERHKAAGQGPRRRPTAERLAEGKRILRQRAKELGIVLDDGTERENQPHGAPSKGEGVTVGIRGSKARSPVA